eukprot:sb/3475225/
MVGGKAKGFRPVNRDLGKSGGGGKLGSDCGCATWARFWAWAVCAYPIGGRDTESPSVVWKIWLYATFWRQMASSNRCNKPLDDWRPISILNETKIQSDLDLVTPDLVTPRFSDRINFPRYKKLTVMDLD